MNAFFKPFSIILFTVLAVSCGNENRQASKLFSLEIENDKKGYSVTETLTVSVKSKKGNVIDKVTCYLDDEKLNSEAASATIPLENKKLGERILKAEITSEDEAYTLQKTVTVLAAEKPELYTYKILETYPHDSEAYTQGLEFHNDTLYESTGQYEKSSLRKLNYKTGEVLQKVDLKNNYFGEGLTIKDGKIYQLTYQEEIGFIYNLETLEQTGTFVYNESKEGWGLCNDGKNIYKSDGTEKIWNLNPNTLAEETYIEIYTNKDKIPKVNELEWVEGKIYANIYLKGSIAIVNPNNGAVEGVIDLTDLKDEVTQHPQLDVLNGIAYKGEPNILYVTGKNWDKLFKIEIMKK